MLHPILNMIRVVTSRSVHQTTDNRGVAEQADRRACVRSDTYLKLKLGLWGMSGVYGAHTVGF